MESGRRSKRTEALDLAKSVRTDLYSGSKPLSLLLLQCRTICKYLDRMEANEWIDLELNGYYTKWDKIDAFIKNIPEYRKVNPVLFDDRGRPLQVPYEVVEPFTKRMALGEPIAQLENTKVFSLTGGALMDALNAYLNKLLEENGYSQRNIVYYAQFAENHLRSVVSGLRNKIADFIDEIILELEYGAIPEEIFETLRAEVDQKLANLSPNTIEKLKNAYEKLGSGRTEDWSHVASTCRRVIKDVADVVFPPQDTPQKGKDGKEHVVDDRHVINRIIAGINADLGKGKNATFTQAMIDYIGTFLSGIQEYASKGDHSTFQKTDAVRCLVYTYMLLGDILNYHIDKDKRNTGEQKSSEEEPDITIVNFHPEYTQNRELKLFPNFRNDGISARNLKIHYKLFEEFADLSTILKHEEEIKKKFIHVPGTIRNGESVNLNDGKPESGIPFPDDELERSLVLWFTYDFGEKEKGEVVLDLQYYGNNPTSKHPVRYTSPQIRSKD